MEKVFNLQEVISGQRDGVAALVPRRGCASAYEASEVGECFVLREGVNRQQPGARVVPLFYYLSNMIPPDWRVQQKDKLGWPAIRKDRFVGRRFRLNIHVRAHEVRVPLE